MPGLKILVKHIIRKTWPLNAILSCKPGQHDSPVVTVSLHYFLSIPSLEKNKWSIYMLLLPLIVCHKVNPLIYADISSRVAAYANIRPMVDWFICLPPDIVKTNTPKAVSNMMNISCCRPIHMMFGYSNTIAFMINTIAFNWSKWHGIKVFPEKRDKYVPISTHDYAPLKSLRIVGATKV